MESLVAFLTIETAENGIFDLNIEEYGIMAIPELKACEHLLPIEAAVSALCLLEAFTNHDARLALGYLFMALAYSPATRQQIKVHTDEAQGLELHAISAPDELRFCICRPGQSLHTGMVIACDLATQSLSGTAATNHFRLATRYFTADIE